MRLTLIQLSTFATKWSKLGLTDEDLRALEGLDANATSSQEHNSNPASR
jgi:hypothetical protein